VNRRGLSGAGADVMSDVNEMGLSEIGADVMTGDAVTSDSVVDVILGSSVSSVRARLGSGVVASKGAGLVGVASIVAGLIVES